MKYDAIKLLAKNKNGDVTSACRWGNTWYFIYESKNGNDCGRIGNYYNSLQSLLCDAKNYILDECGYNFIESDLTPLCKMVQLKDSQRVAINTAISLLSDSNSDHAEQCIYHLKTI